MTACGAAHHVQRARLDGELDNTGTSVRVPDSAGFAGCNRYSAPFRIDHDNLSFGPAISTKMACTEGMELERRFLIALPVITTFARTDSTLTLSGPSGPLAQFHLR